MKGLIFKGLEVNYEKGKTRKFGNIPLRKELSEYIITINLVVTNNNNDLKEVVDKIKEIVDFDK